jgi:hypothetical protein
MRHAFGRGEVRLLFVPTPVCRLPGIGQPIVQVLIGKAVAGLDHTAALGTIQALIDDPATDHDTHPDPTMAVTLAGFIAVRVAITLWVRPHYMSAVTAFSSAMSSFTPSGDYGKIAQGVLGPNGQPIPSRTTRWTPRLAGAPCPGPRGVLAGLPPNMKES